MLLPSACTSAKLADEKRGAGLKFERIGRTSGASQLVRQMRELYSRFQQG